ncbi:hypothetical protein UFOVP787_95 [uncultured Caudovirales phage]|uniref:Uncharacterized protein n=1 Tax=uncultured Caudovirales phage TaxID=2100421 RepID=A0A6J5NTG5_9CAUD|nr:hypothetical protein UFOVP787_95 [uncultured Caudovirales phage]
MVNILNESSFLSSSDIQKIEDKYNGVYIFESCIRNRFGGWVNFPVAVFHSQIAHPDGSNYFGIYLSPIDGSLMICNAISAVEEGFEGLQVGNDVIYSRYRHDYRQHNGYFVDGGRDYLRYGGEDLTKANPVKLKIVVDKLVLDERN